MMHFASAPGKPADGANTSRIYLIRTHTGWEAVFGGPLGSEMLELFGTNRLPTAWTARAPERDVIAGIRAKNPGVDVVVAVTSLRGSDA